MANHLHRILVVASNGGVVERVLRSVPGHEIVLRTDFESARLELDRHPPDLVVAQVRLGAFNGLHLAIRARGRGLPTQTILIGEPDAVLELEAKQQHAHYLTWPVDQATLAATIHDVLTSADATLPDASLVAAGSADGHALAASV
jgi:DNA-binding response OmpR family regulator